MKRGTAYAVSAALLCVFFAAQPALKARNAADAPATGLFAAIDRKSVV